MRHYETMVIFDAEIEEADITAVLDRAAEVVRSGGGEQRSLDRWGRRQFAYEMKHRREGYYVVVEFSGSPAVASELDRFLDLSDEVLRHKTVRLPDSFERSVAKASVDRAPKDAGVDRASNPGGVDEASTNADVQPATTNAG
jgi:small subunit ribosomal protein S6